MTKLKLFAFERTSSYFDYILYILNIPSINKVNHSNCILFVGEQLPPRIPRMAKWISRLSDYNPILVCHKDGFNLKFSDPSFKEIILFRNAWHLKRILKQIKNIEIIHGFAPKSYYCNITRKFLNKMYIHDMQDVYSIYYENEIKLKWLQKELPHEVECLKNADGIIAHSLEPNVALRKIIFNKLKKPKTLFFPLYCDDDFYQVPIRNINFEEIHIVYVGGIAGSFRNPNQHGNIQFIDLIEILSEQKLHFHIYPSPTVHESDCKEYKEISQGNAYFHFHDPIDQKELAKELSKYDFGILPFFNSKSKLSANKVKYATSLKLFNYIEAGLPIIISEDIVFQNWITNKYRLAINIQLSDLSSLSEKIKSENSLFTNQKIIDSRELLSLKKNTIRLITFYNNLTNKKLNND